MVDGITKRRENSGSGAGNGCVLHPPKWTAKRIEKAQLRIALDAADVYVEADDKTTKAMALAMSAKRAALLESARCLEESAAWLTAAQALAANTGIENWVTPGDAGGGGDTGGGDTNAKPGQSLHNPDASGKWWRSWI